MDWQPSCNKELLQIRAHTLQKIRQFFAERHVLEVETPLLCSGIGTDPNLDFFTTQFHWSPNPQKLYLQTSPEFAMKRLLASGSGSIYQVCKAFRNGESGRYHNPEFTMLEWYRVGYDLQQLMAEVVALIRLLFHENNKLKTVKQISYQQVFQQHTHLDALAFCYEDYAAYAKANGLDDALALCGNDHSLWLDIIFSHKVQPFLADHTLWLVYGYPACLPSLARVNKETPLITDRVELFMEGVELGNGYYELGDATEQSQRFDQEIAIRKANQQPEVGKDERLLAALRAGLPDCSGIAIGLDRLLMLLADKSSIKDVLVFPLSRA